MSTDETPPEGAPEFPNPSQGSKPSAWDKLRARWPQALKGPVAIPLAILITLALGAAIGAFHGFGIVQLGLPPFIMLNRPRTSTSTTSPMTRSVATVVKLDMPCIAFVLIIQSSARMNR